MHIHPKTGFRDFLYVVWSLSPCRENGFHVILTLSGAGSYWCRLCVQEGVVSRDLPPQEPHKPVSQLSQATHLMGFFSFSFPKWPNQESQVDTVLDNVQNPSHPFFLQRCLSCFILFLFFVVVFCLFLCVCF